MTSILSKDTDYINPFHAEKMKEGILKWIRNNQRDFRYFFLLTYRKKEYSMINVEQDLKKLQSRLSNDIYGRKRNIEDPHQNVSFISFIESHSDGSLHVHVLMESLGEQAKTKLYRHKKQYNLKRQKGLSKLITHHWIRLQHSKNLKQAPELFDTMANKLNRMRKNRKLARRIKQKIKRKNVWIMHVIRGQQIRCIKKIQPINKIQTNKPTKIIHYKNQKFIEVIVTKIQDDRRTGLYEYFCKRVKYNLEAVSYMNLRKISKINKY